MSIPTGGGTTWRWEQVVPQLTGFDGGTREEVGAVGGADAKTGDGSEWMTISIKDGDNSRQTTGELASPGSKLGRTMHFYGVMGRATQHLSVYTVNLSLPMESSNGADWSNTGNAGAFDWGYGQVLAHFLNHHRSGGYSFSSSRTVKEEDSVDLATFPLVASAYDRLTAYFRERGPVLEGWLKDLDAEHSAYQGSGADVFRDLVDALSVGYKDFLTRISPAAQRTKNEPVYATYYSDSAVGDQILDAENAIHLAAFTLWHAWDTWQRGSLWMGSLHLDKLLDELALWLNANNIAKMRQIDEYAYAGDKGGGVMYVHPEYGDLTKPDAWKALSRKAFQDWQATLVPLDQTATRVVLDLNQALSRAGSVPAFRFTPGTSSLKEANAADEAGKAKADAEKEKEGAKKELDKYKDGGAGGDGAGTGKIPPLDPNAVGGGGGGGLGGGLGAGKDGPGSGKGGLGKLPPLVPNPTGPGGGLGGGQGTVVHNPDGSTTVTTPDGNRTTYPPGVTPPPLLPNGTGGLTPGGSLTVVKKAKGPDGSTTSYNSDGSRTTTHKDGTSTTVRPDGTTETLNPDGSKTVLNKDGSETITYRDGTKTTVRPDGSTLTAYPDGTSTRHAPDGTLTTTDADGRSTTSHPRPGSTVRNPDGSTTLYGGDGATTTTRPDGTRTTVAPNGTVTTLDPDGTKTVSHLGKGTSTIQYADGSVSQVGRDGTVSTTYKDGSTTRLAPDGTYTTVDAGGHKTTEHLNVTGGGSGPQTTHHPDGSSTTKYPDGTVDKTLKDGGHRITYPDGRTVTTDAYGRTTGGSALTPDRTSSRLSDHGYYDYPDRKGTGSPTGSGPGGPGSGGPRMPLLPMNPVGTQGLTPGGVPGGPAAGAERTRAVAAAESSAARGRAAQLAAEEAALVGRRPGTTSQGMPMMPPMGGGMGGAPSTQSDERQRSTWVSEDEETWGTEGEGVSGAIGR
ncbi:AAWKG family protein [Streptomyces sp. NPDC001941]|uniref:AAWKG family protein n=1 Tax=Streptomyces sp. NPDC001941 TaxID=3154659 RepID=UPI003325C46C